MELGDLYRRAVAGFEERLRHVGSNAWGERTLCCPDWTIRDLVNHVVGEFRWIPPLLAGESLSDVGDRFDGDLLGDDAVAAWRDAGDAVLEAIGDPDVDTVELSSGPTSVTDYLSEVLSDVTIHTWDLATSVDADPVIDPALLDFAERTLEPRIESWRAAGVLGEPLQVGADADRQTKLLALLGRRS